MAGASVSLLVIAASHLEYLEYSDDVLHTNCCPVGHGNWASSGSDLTNLHVS